MIAHAKIPPNFSFHWTGGIRTSGWYPVGLGLGRGVSCGETAETWGCEQVVARASA